MTPLNCHTHAFEMIQMESLRDKLARLKRDKGYHRE
jgi:hypothetical protein